MTEITLFWEEGALCGIEGRGHSGFADRGNDIVCAAVSSLLQALVLGLSDVAKKGSFECEVEPETPLIRARWPRERAEELSLLTVTVARSLREIQSGNPGYVNITEVRL